jgi:hypothetical protein
MHAVKKYYLRRKVLVWNTRLRMERGVGVTGNVARLQSEIPSFSGGGRVVYSQQSRGQG